MKFIRNMKKKNNNIEARREIWEKRSFSLSLPPFLSLFCHRVIFHQDWTADYELLMIFRCCRFRDGCLKASFFCARSVFAWKLDFCRRNISYFRNPKGYIILHFSRRPRPNDLFNSETIAWCLEKTDEYNN